MLTSIKTHNIYTGNILLGIHFTVPSLFDISDASFYIQALSTGPKRLKRMGNVHSDVDYHSRNREIWENFMGHIVEGFDELFSNCLGEIAKSMDL